MFKCTVHSFCPGANISSSLLLDAAGTSSENVITLSNYWMRPRGGGGGGGGTDSHMKWIGMLVVSLRGVNFGFWSRLGCSGQNVVIFSRQGLV